MIVYDQDRVFVVDENFGNIVLVPRFEEYVKKVGFSVRFCRPHDPQSKGKVETFVRYIKESFLAGRIYKGFDSLNSDALRWLDAEGNGTTNLRTRKPPRVKFREEAQHLTRVQFSDEGFSEIRSVSDKYAVKIDWSVYELPRTAVKPFEQVRVEEQDGMLLFYKAAENELIHKLASWHCIRPSSNEASQQRIMRRRSKNTVNGYRRWKPSRQNCSPQRTDTARSRCGWTASQNTSRAAAS